MAVSGWRRRIWSISQIPSWPGMRTSHSATSTSMSRMTSRAFSAPSAACTAYPMSATQRVSTLRTPSSSSTTRMVPETCSESSMIRSRGSHSRIGATQRREMSRNRPRKIDPGLRSCAPPHTPGRSAHVQPHKNRNRDGRAKQDGLKRDRGVRGSLVLEPTNLRTDEPANLRTSELTNRQTYKPANLTNHTSVERIAEAEHELVDVRQPGVRLERLRHELVVRHRQPVGDTSLRINRGSGEDLGAVRLRNRYDHALADTPVVIQEVSEVREVDSELSGIALSTEVGEDVLGDAEVHSLLHREEDPAALGV